MTTLVPYAIVGFGLEGQSTYRFLLNQWVSPEDICIVDDKPIEAPPWSSVFVWSGSYTHLAEAKQIFLTPGITLHMLAEKLNDTSLFATIRPRLTSQTHYFFEQYKGVIIWVTGTKGKSTIATLTYQTLKNAWKHVQLVGNVGTPVLDEVDRTHPPAIVVYEMSSFMIEKLYTDNSSVRILDIAIFNTLYPAHTREHGGYEQYAHAKVQLLSNAQTALIWYQAYEVIQTSFPSLKLPTNTFIYGKTWKRTRHDGWFEDNGNKLFTDEGMLLLGEHNRYNACAVVGVCQILGIDLAVLHDTLQSFGGLEHRIEYVGAYAGIHRYNDAIATTPQATMAAIDSFGNQLDTIFLWGIEGEYEFHGVVDLLEKYHVPHIILFPDTGARIKSLLDLDKHHIFETRSMQDAVTRAAHVTTKNKVALLSCGSPSFSLWSSYKEKGTLFKEAVRLLS